MISLLQIAAIVLAGFAAILSITLFLQLRWPAPVMWFLKLYVAALSPVLVLIGLMAAIVGITTGSIFLSIVGIYVALIFLIHIFLVTRPPVSPGSFENVFGAHWKSILPPSQKKYFLRSRRILNLPSVPEPLLEQDISFCTIPGSDRKLLCDVWQPAANVTPSGLAFIYLHGSAFYFLDKDFNTRPFFRHLAAQGYVIMDVAYRLAPETDVMGMVHDIKRAIDWMKENAKWYCVDPSRIVVGGGSAGGHLALLAAYTANDPQFTPKELEGKDLDVSAVISMYGSNDMEALYYHTNQHLTSRNIPGRPKISVPTKMPAWIVKKMGKEFYRLGMHKDFENIGALAPLLGGHPDECPENYALYSAITHVHPGCPPTLLIHGEDDILAPVKSTRLLYAGLIKERVPTVMHFLPQTDHGFDLIMPKISPSAHTAIYDVELFLALQNKSLLRPWKKEKQIKEYDLSHAG